VLLDFGANRVVTGIFSHFTVDPHSAVNGPRLFVDADLHKVGVRVALDGFAELTQLGPVFLREVCKFVEPTDRLRISVSSDRQYMFNGKLERGLPLLKL
jgi:hypothetical protein